MMAESDVRLMPYENAEGMEGTRRILESIEPGESIAILIGPEGGIDEAEVEMAMKEKVEPITLGKRILRTETAGMTVLSILVYLLEGRNEQDNGSISGQFRNHLCLSGNRRSRL